MAATQLLKARVSSQMKQHVHALAEREHINESIWLRRLVAAALQTARHCSFERQPEPPDVLADPSELATRRVCIRLRNEDRLLLRERSAARGLASATYVSVLVRAHLRHLAPLPKDELKALKRSVAELSAIGRLLNQLVRAANQGQRTVVGEEYVMTMLQLCEAMRSHISGLIRRNVESWEVGHARDSD